MNIITYILAVVFILFNANFYHKVNCLNVDLSACQAYNWNACGIAVGTAIYKHYESWNDTDTKQAFGTTCNLKMKGPPYPFFWRWDLKFWCPSLSSTIKGDSAGRKSRAGAIEHAIQDYVTKMTAAGLLKPEQLTI
ncbi:hypothetical protein I4U23_027193 [Adineta vaga]|nr:hypothetical protein I4U23_027193 [Adineta vaga]